MTGKLRLPRAPLVHLVTDSVLMGFAFYLGLYLRVGPEEFVRLSNKVHLLAFSLIGIKLSALVLSGSYRMIWRYFSLGDLLVLWRSLLIAVFAAISTTYFLSAAKLLPRGTFVIESLLLFSMLTGVRVLRRLVHEFPSRYQLSKKGKKTLVYGGGRKGRNLLYHFSSDKARANHVIGIIDDDPKKAGGVVGGIRVLGNGKSLARVLKETRAEELYVAIWMPKGSILRNILEVCHAHKVKVRLVQSGDPESQSTNRPLYRPLELTDLLRRKRRQLDLSSVRRLIAGRTVLVTGAGGSIGSELAKQIFSYRPSRIVILDHSELNLYQIDREIRKLDNSDTEIFTCLADIKDRRSLQLVFREHRPHLVFHAAAYKHVHLAEASPYSTILNNVLGTRNLLQLSQLSEFVECFVLISTDKAVSPGGIMGASKRICELMTTEAGLASGKRFVSVRFGNVLGSSGSLIPLLKKQIENNEAITITHEEMRRYFMLIPEAVSLVLRASSMARGGDIMVLKMGEPVKIVELAKSLISLMGRRQEDTPIVFTGLRPGEKLCEELYLSGDELSTEDPDIMVLPRGDAAFSRQGFEAPLLSKAIEELISLAVDGNIEAFSKVEALIGNKLKHRPTNGSTRPIVPIPTYIPPSRQAGDALASKEKQPH